MTYIQYKKDQETFYLNVFNPLFLALNRLHTLYASINVFDWYLQMSLVRPVGSQYVCESLTFTQIGHIRRWQIGVTEFRRVPIRFWGSKSRTLRTLQTILCKKYCLVWHRSSSVTFHCVCGGLRRIQCKTKQISIALTDRLLYYSNWISAGARTSTFGCFAYSVYNVQYLQNPMGQLQRKLRTVLTQDYLSLKHQHELKSPAELISVATPIGKHVAAP